MKSLLMPAFLPALITIASVNCEKEENKVITYQDQGYVIGFDPCKKSVGRVMALSNLEGINNRGDTIVSYNFPDSLYSFPSNYFSEYRSRYLFPDSTLNKYPITLTYRYATSSEKQYYPCLGSINTPFSQDVKDRQVIILRINKK